MKPSTYSPNYASGGTAHERKSSPGLATGDVQTLTVPKGTSAVLLTVETNAARVTFDGSDPGAASAPSIVFPKDSVPVRVDVGHDATIKFCSTAAAASVLQAVYLT